MGSGIERLVNTMLSLEQLKIQRQQLAQAQAAQEVGIMERLPDLLGQVRTDEERAEIFRTFAPYTRYSPENLAAAFGETPTNLEVQRAAAVEGGDEEARSVAFTGALTGQVEESRTLASALRGGLGEPLQRGAQTRVATGQDIGSFTRSLLFADQPRETQQRVFNIETGLELSAAQQADVEQGYAGLRIQEHLGLLNAALQEAGLQLQQRLALAKEQGGIDLETRFQAMDYLRKIADALGGPTAKEMTPDMQAAYILQYNDVARQINVPEIDPSKDIGHAGFLPSMRRGNVDAAATSARLRMLEQQNANLQRQLQQLLTGQRPPAPAARPDTTGMIDILQSIRNR